MSHFASVRVSQALIAYLRQRGVHSTRSTTFVQGRTVRWALAWSFFEVAPPSSKDKVLGAKKEATRRSRDAFAVAGVTRDELSGRVVAFLGTARGSTVFECSPFVKCVGMLDGVLVCFLHGALDLSGAALEPAGNVAGGVEGGGAGKRARKRKRGTVAPVGVGESKDDAGSVGAGPAMVADVSRRVLFRFRVQIICCGGDACTAEDLPQSGGGAGSWAIHVSFLGAADACAGVAASGADDDGAAGPARQAFWKFYDALCGDVSRTTRKWRRKEAKPTATLML